MNPLLRHIRRLNRHDPARFRTVVVNGTAIGRLPRPAAEILARQAGWRLQHHELHLHGDGVAATSARLARAQEVLREAGWAPRLRGETFALRRHWGAPVLARADRALFGLFGFPAFGVHLHGLVGREEEMRMWIARRGFDRRIAPGKLDNMVAGGQPAGLGLGDNLIKEAGEEAGLDPALAGRARPVGMVRYGFDLTLRQDGWPTGFRNDTLFLYELEMPADVRPVPDADEVAGFALWPVAEVLARVAETDDFKFNVPLTIIDFALRRGLIDPDEPGYDAIASGLIQPL